MAELLKTLGQMAGIGGICAGIFLLICREVVRKNVYSKLNSGQSFRLLRLSIILSWTIAVIGIIAWIVSTQLGQAVVAEVHGELQTIRTQTAQTAELMNILVLQKTALNSDPVVFEPVRADAACRSMEEPYGKKLSLVCRLKQISCLEPAAEQAERILPPPVTDMKLSAIYITCLRNRTTYAHSNFVTEGYENPTKLASDAEIDLETIALNVFFDALPDTAGIAAMKNALRADVEIFVDERLFKPDGTLPFDVSMARNILVVSGTAVQTLRDWKLRRAARLNQGSDA